MTTNEQRDTAAILQMKADLDEALRLLRLCEPRLSQLKEPILKGATRELLARAEPKHGETE